MALLSDISKLESFYFICIPFQTLLSVIAIIVGLKLWRQIFTISQDSKMNKAYRNASIICSVGGILCLLSDLSHVYWCAISGDFLFAVLQDKVYSNADFWYYIAVDAFYIIAFMKLRVTFKDTSYQMTKRVKYMIICVLGIGIMAQIYHIVIVIRMTSVEFYYQYGTPGLIVEMVTDFILNSTLMILFAKRLKKSILDKETSFNVEWNIDENKDGERRFSLSFSDFSRSSRSMIDVVTLHCVLFGIAIFTNQLFLTSLLRYRIMNCLCTTDDISLYLHLTLYKLLL